MFLNLFISSSRFCVDSLGFSIYSITSCAYHYNLTCSHPIWMIFTSFSCLIAMASTSNIMLKRSDESGHPFLVSDFGWIGFQLFTIKYYVGYRFDTNSFLYFEICSMHTHCGKIFYHEWMLNFEKSFFCFYWENRVVFVFCLCGVAHWFIWTCWTHLMNFEWITLSHCVWTFLCAVGFSMLIFCWEYLHLYF